MKSFKQFIKEDKDPKFRTDNPGGEWLANKKKRAEEGMKNHKLDRQSIDGKGLQGSTTGYFTHHLKLPVHELKHVPGAMGEEEHRDNFNSHKHKELTKSVEKHGFDTSKHPILIGINHHGKPHVLEGNHRLAHAIKHGHEHIHAHVQYYNGGEEVKGQGFHPAQLLHHHRGGKWDPDGHKK